MNIRYSSCHSSYRSSFRSSFGFTLVELIVVILLLGLLAVNALPHFSTSGYDEHTLKNELSSLLRLVQLKNMHSAVPAPKEGQNNKPRLRYWLSINSDHYQQKDSSSPPQTPYPEVAIPKGVAITAGNFEFDQMGRPINSCNGGCTINITGQETTQIIIESEGYIHD